MKCLLSCFWDLFWFLKYNLFLCIHTHTLSYNGLRCRSLRAQLSDPNMKQPVYFTIFYLYILWSIKVTWGIYGLFELMTFAASPAEPHFNGSNDFLRAFAAKKLRVLRSVTPWVAFGLITCLYHKSWVEEGEGRAEVILNLKAMRNAFVRSRCECEDDCEIFFKEYLLLKFQRIAFFLFYSNLDYNIYIIDWFHI